MQAMTRRRRHSEQVAQARLLHPYAARGAALLVLAALPGCNLLSGLSGEPQRPYAPVVLVGTERLDRPAVASVGDVFRPAYSFAVDDADAARGQAVGFFVTLVTGDPNSLAFRLTDEETGADTRLVRVPPPGDATERAAAATPRAFNADTRSRLAGGAGLWWLDAGAGNATYRFAVLIPAGALSAFTRLQMYASAAPDGTPINAAALELVRDFFYLAIIGDSLLWGNGLEEQDKFTALASQTLERETGRKVIGQRYAQSGACIVPAPGDSVCQWSCSGEVPVASTSITLQADLIERPELMDLILMGGCINDVGLDAILLPGMPMDDLTELTQRFCRDEMTTLLRKVRRLAPQARVVVTGYYPIIGPDSDSFAIRIWSQVRGLLGAAEAPLVPTLAAQSADFETQARAALLAAVQQVNADADPSAASKVAFAGPGFGPDHATFAPQPWLWGLTSDAAFLQNTTLDYELFPEDPLRDFRLSNCSGPNVGGDQVQCIYESVGHPNRRGARAYADAVVASLRTLGVLPPVAARQ